MPPVEVVELDPVAGAALEFRPVFSPDGRYVLNQHVGFSQTSDLRLYDLLTDNLSILVTYGQGNFPMDPTFSADGTSFAYTLRQNVAHQGTAAEGVYFKPFPSTNSDPATYASPTIDALAPNGDSFLPKFAPNGGSLIYESDASNLVAGDTNGVRDIFSYSLAGGTVTRLSTNGLGEQADGHSFQASFSPDGSKLLFASGATNLIDSDRNGVADIFIKDVATGSVTLISTNALGATADGASTQASFSPDGTKVVFESEATNLVAGDTNGLRDVFVKDLVSGAVTLVTVSQAGVQADAAHSEPMRPMFSPDGNSILFSSSATTLIPGGTNGAQQVFIKSLVDGSVTLVSANPAGTQGNSVSYNATFSPDGSAVAFVSHATNLTGGPGSGASPYQGLFLAILSDGAGQTITGTPNPDNLTGTAGDDYIDGLASADTMTGLGGSDTYIVDNAGDVVVEGITQGIGDIVLTSVSYVLPTDAAVEILGLTDPGGFAAIDLTGNDFVNVIAGNNGGNALIGLGGGDTLNGYGGNDALLGGAGSDALSGGDGDDYLDGGSDRDTLSGGLGDDIYVVDLNGDGYSPGSHLGDFIIELAGEGFDRVYALTTYALPTNAEIEVLAAGGPDPFAAIDLTGNGFANNLWGNEGTNWLHGLGGSDSVFGFGGNDYLDGGTGLDFLVGGTGDDIYVVDDGQDRALEYAGEGQDRLYAMTSYTLNAGSAIEILIAGGAVQPGVRNLTGNELDNNIWDDAGNGDLYGAAGNDALFGFGGLDYLDGGTGADLLVGGTGNDIYSVDNVGDAVVELAGEGTDRVYSSIDYTLAAGQSIEIIVAGGTDPNAPLSLTGNELANNLWGNAGGNTLDGVGGDDAVFGFGGNDTLFGGDGNDFVVGGAGDDTVSGGDGADTLVGEAGNDSFLFNTPPAGGIDTIGDFSVADDQIALDDAVFAGLAPGALAAGAFVAGTAAADADDRVIYDAATGALWFDADGNGAGAAVQFATLNGSPALTAGDFLII